jgi:hypothetical protein
LEENTKHFQDIYFSRNCRFLGGQDFGTGIYYFSLGQVRIANPSVPTFLKFGNIIFGDFSEFRLSSLNPEIKPFIAPVAAFSCGGAILSDRMYQKYASFLNNGRLSADDGSDREELYLGVWGGASCVYANIVYFGRDSKYFIKINRSDLKKDQTFILSFSGTGKNSSGVVINTVFFDSGSNYLLDCNGLLICSFGSCQTKILSDVKPTDPVEQESFVDIYSLYTLDSLTNIVKIGTFILQQGANISILNCRFIYFATINNGTSSLTPRNSSGSVHLIFDTIILNGNINLFSSNESINSFSTIFFGYNLPVLSYSIRFGSNFSAAWMYFRGRNAGFSN